MSRADTERRLEDSARRLLERNGVLAGLNLREVADDAGVNRGIVYHYYGSRRDLLRAALRRDADDRFGAVRGLGDLGLARRWRRFVELMSAHADAVRLLALLVLDGDDETTVTPLRHEIDAQLEQEKVDGSLDDSVDTVGLHAAVVSLAWGYAIFREALARDNRMSPGELDEAVAGVVERLADGLAPRPDAT